MTKIENKQALKLQITSFSKDGNGLGHCIDDYGTQASVEVPFSVPGDLVKAKIQRKSGGVYKANLLEVLSPSADRIAPKCSHFGTCGGCRFQHISYEQQLMQKEALVRHAFSKLLTKDATFHPIIGSNPMWGYRNKVDYSFSIDKSGRKTLGFKAENNKGMVFDILECHLTSPWFLSVTNAVRQWWLGLPPSVEKEYWTFRTLTVREGHRTGDRMVVLTVSGIPELDAQKKYLESLTACIRQVATPPPQSRLSIFLRMQQTNEGDTTNVYEIRLYGEEYIREHMKVQVNEKSSSEVLEFKISPSTFFHHNVFQAEHLYSVASKLIKLPKKVVIYHLYCGLGSLAYFFAKHATQIIGVEISPEVVAEAERNAKLNHCNNITFFSGAVRHTLNEVVQKGYPQPELLLLSPPRPGLDRKSMEAVLQLKVPTILYVSSNPYSQALDAEQLIHHGYKIEAVQPADHFPQTSHVENILVMTKE